jgi:mono/diheme cytochrome c family protein
VRGRQRSNGNEPFGAEGETLKGHRTGLGLGSGSAALLAVLAVGTHSTAGAAGAKGARDAAVERGRYLVTITGCNDCHTPFKMGPNGPEPDMARMLSGHPEGLRTPPPPKLAGPWLWVGTGTNTAFAGPWGVSYARNITPDELTGIGSWSQETFVKSMKSGRHMGVSRPIQPPMPWIWYSKMTDRDLQAIYAYLRTVPPIRNDAPDWEPPPGAKK